jgi:peptide/nickel transport system substrate-binding protein
MKLGIFLPIALLLVSCSGAPAPSSSQVGAEQPSGATRSQTPATPKRVVIPLPGTITVLASVALQGGPPSGTLTEPLIHVGLTMPDPNAQLHPELAEAVPSIENGLWKLNADGTMETTWRIRPGAQWHDGTPFTSEDLLFTSQIEQDREVPRGSRSDSWSSVERVEAPDASTFTIHWNKPYIDADRMFSTSGGTGAGTSALPFPKHLLERVYQSDKTTLMTQSYWSSEFVGTGPFKVREYEAGSHVILDANPAFALGRPKIDVIEVRAVPDTNAIVASTLAGVIDLSISGNVSVEQALSVREAWSDGRVDFAAGRIALIFGQYIDASPAIVTSTDFRKALVYATDREALEQTLNHGVSKVAHTFLLPNQPQYQEIEARVPKYEYDPRKAEQMIGDLGYSKRPDGFWYDAGGQKLNVELRTTELLDVQVKTATAVADYWKAVGVGTDLLVIPLQRQGDTPYRATFPAFEHLIGTPTDLAGVRALRSNQARVPPNFGGSNYSRYQSPELDAIIDRFFVTIPPRERMDVLGQFIYHMADRLPVLTLYYTPSPLMLRKDLAGPVAPTSPAATVLWNAQDWDYR